MSAVTISKRFQVVIPKKIRQQFRLRAGQRVAVLDYDGQIRLMPLQPIKHLRGFLKSIDKRCRADSHGGLGHSE